jgi:hypothetical protein
MAKLRAMLLDDQPSAVEKKSDLDPGAPGDSVGIASALSLLCIALSRKLFSLFNALTA